MSVLVAAITAIIVYPQGITGQGSVGVPVAWCEMDGRKWGELGNMCHADPKMRRPVLCVAKDVYGNIGTALSTAMCEVPNGFENVK